VELIPDTTEAKESGGASIGSGTNLHGVNKT